MSSTTLSPELLERLGARIAAHAGLEPKSWVLESRVNKRVQALGLETPDAYIELLTSAAGLQELELLLEALRVGETRFFRHRSHVKAFADVVVPAIRTAKRGKRVRVWSAGCATGEEAYTLAMILAKHVTPATSVSILATDISTDALATAKRRVYNAAALNHVPDEWRSWAFTPDGSSGNWRVADHVAKLVSFERRNLADGGFQRGYDVIWCRNVLIYFTPEARERAIDRLIDSLNPGGFLFVGYAESLRDFAALDAVRTPDAVLYRKAAELRAPEANAKPREQRTPSSSTRGSVPLPARNPALTAEEAVIELSGRYDDGDRLAGELGAALSGPYQAVIVDLDGAEFLCDDAGPVMKRARSAARSAGIQFSMVAERSGTKRWLRRCGLLEGGES